MSLQILKKECEKMKIFGLVIMTYNNHKKMCTDNFIRGMKYYTRLKK